MDKLLLNPTDTSQWQALVQEAQQQRSFVLNEDLESYLVFLLMRFSTQPEMVSSVFATDYLESVNCIGESRQIALRDIGDKCLIFSGLFPENAKRRRVKVSYFVDIGQSAYATLSMTREEEIASLFSSLCEDFVTLMDVLQATRDISGSETLLPLDALERWHETGSERALDMLQASLNGSLVKMDFDREH